MGLPFFTPLYMPGCRIRFASGYHGKPLREFLHRQMSAPMFPVDLGQVPSQHEFLDLTEGHKVTFGDIDVEICLLNHPDPVYAFRLTHGDRSVVYATDTEHYACIERLGLTPPSRTGGWFHVTYRKRRGLTPPSRTGGKGGGRWGASAGPPSRPPCIPPPRPPAGARRMQARRFVHPGSLFRAPCPSPAGTGPAGLGAVRMRVLLGVVATGERTSWRPPA
jgi:hypothetical protein